MVSIIRGLFGAKREIDPVCGMEVDPRNPPGGSGEHEGKLYYFCGTGCRLEFTEDPVGYLSGEKEMEM